MAGAHMSSRAVGAHGGHQSSLPSEAVPNHVGTCVTGLSCQRALVGVTVARRSLGLRESRNPSAPLATDEVVDDPCGIYSWPYCARSVVTLNSPLPHAGAQEPRCQ